MTEVMTAIVFCLKQAPGSADGGLGRGGQKVTSSSLYLGWARHRSFPRTPVNSDTCSEDIGTTSENNCAV